MQDAILRRYSRGAAMRFLTRTFFVIFVLAAPALAQLPADAVQLDKVKIPERQKSADLCPVYLEPSDAKLPAWEYKGVTYRGSRQDSKEKFFQNPDRYAEAAKKQRFINNFMLAMSAVWCPVTDQITPGGMKQWKRFDLTFESCCGFCDENAKEEDFKEGLERLRKRAEETYNLIGARYTEGAASPVEGAIKKQ
jgi:YHS domain-containing protein